MSQGKELAIINLPDAPDVLRGGGNRKKRGFYGARTIDKAEPHTSETPAPGRNAEDDV